MHNTFRDSLGLDFPFELVNSPKDASFAQFLEIDHAVVARHALTFNRDQSDRNAQQECHLIGSVRLEAMITIARYGGTTLPRPQRALAMTVLFVVTIPAA